MPKYIVGRTLRKTPDHPQGIPCLIVDVDSVYCEFSSSSGAELAQQTADILNAADRRTSTPAPAPVERVTFDQWYEEFGEGETTEHVARKAWFAATVFASRARTQQEAQPVQGVDESIAGLIEDASNKGFVEGRESALSTLKQRLREGGPCLVIHLPEGAEYLQWTVLASPPVPTPAQKSSNYVSDRIRCAIEEVCAERCGTDDIADSVLATMSEIEWEHRFALASPPKESGR